MGNVRCRRVRPVDLGARAVFVYFHSSMAKSRGGSSVVTLLNAGVCCGGAVRRLCLGELPVTPAHTWRRNSLVRVRREPRGIEACGDERISERHRPTQVLERGRCLSPRSIGRQLEATCRRSWKSTTQRFRRGSRRPIPSPFRSRAGCTGSRNTRRIAGLFGWSRTRVASRPWLSFSSFYGRPAYAKTTEVSV